MEKRGKTKEIILLALAVVLVVVLIISFTSKGPQKTAPAPGEETVATTPDGQDKPDEAKTDEAKAGLPTPEELLGKSPGTSEKRNPFTTPEAQVTAAKPDTPKVDSSDAAASANTQAAANGGIMPIFINDNGLPNPMDTEMLRLTGIIVGQRSSLAVMRKGQTRYFARIGEKIEDGYRVASIGYGKVTLKSTEGKIISLQLGGGE